MDELERQMKNIGGGKVGSTTPAPAVIAVDLGGSTVRAALVVEGGAITFREKIANTFADGADNVLRRIKATIEAVLASNEAKEYEIQGIGVSAAGQIDARTGKVIGSCLPDSDWIGVELARIITETFDLPTKVDNDANAAALGELVYGTAKGYSNVLCLVIGTGVGGGVIIDGELYRGTKGCAAEFGHMSVDYNGVRCHCGHRGCLEMYASGTGIARLGQLAMANGEDSLLSRKVQANGGKVTSELVFEAARAGDTISLGVLGEVGRLLGNAITSLLHIFNPEIVLLNGGVSEQGDFFLDPVRKAVNAQTMPNFQVPIRLGALGPDANLLGAGVLINDNLHNLGFSGGNLHE